MRRLALVFCLFMTFLGVEWEGDGKVPIRQEKNVFVYKHEEALSELLKAWNRKRITVLYLGDSHVQNGALTRVFRKRLQEMFGDGGRGLFFPYSLAKSYAPDDMKSTHSGKWQCSSAMQDDPVLPLGVLGYACRTDEVGASFTVEFSKPLKPGILRIFFAVEGGGAILSVQTDGKLTKIRASSSATSPLKITTKRPTNKVTLSLVSKESEQVSFTIFGVSHERTFVKTFALVHTAGVGGARFDGPLLSTLFVQHLESLSPDLVVLDYGTNDILYNDAIPDKLEQTIRQVIERVRQAVPKATIVLTSVQDLFYKGKNIRSTAEFRTLVQRIATEERCLFWDWFDIAGGQGSLLDWQKQGLARKDLIHLTAQGYELKGQLFFDALKRTIAQWKKRKTKKPM